MGKQPGNIAVIPDCRYNKGVGCYQAGDKCQKCGWNPAVTKSRKERRVKEYAVQR